MPKVIIIGAGVSGLSCAYDLISRGYEVEIYERSGTFGGQAKSLKTNKCFVPYAWRIWTNYYYNFLDITSNIPFSNGKTVRDNIVHIPKYSHELQTSEGRQLSGGNALDPNNFQNRSDYYKLWNKLINMFLLSEKRLRENDITFYDYIDPKDKATEDFAMEFVAPIIGMEAKKATLFCITKGWEVTYMSRSIHTGLFKSGEVYVTNGPYSEVLFDPWAKYLVEQGVAIHTNTTVASLNYDTETKKITSIDTNTKKNIIADDFVICMDQSSVNKLLRNNKELMDIKMLKNSTELMKYGNEMYFGMVLYFSEKFAPPLGTGCAQDQPWKVVIENFAASWEKKYTDSCNSAEIIQASCLDLYPGLNGKMLHECSVEEAIQETIRELQQSKLMKDLKTVSGKSVWDVFNGYDVWPEWVNGKDGKITNKDNFYKFSINKNCWDLMPKTKTPIKNLFFGSVITKTEVPMVSMEIACSNGRHAASAICEKYDVKPPHVYKHPGFLPNLLSPYRGMDWLLFSMGIRSNMLVVFILMNILFIILLILIIRGIYRRFKR